MIEIIHKKVDENGSEIILYKEYLEIVSESGTGVFKRIDVKRSWKGSIRNNSLNNFDICAFIVKRMTLNFPFEIGNFFENYKGSAFLDSVHFSTPNESGGPHSIARKADGSTWTWGDNASGQLGDNTLSNKSSPVSVVGDPSFIEVAGGYYHTMALKADGIESFTFIGVGELSHNGVVL